LTPGLQAAVNEFSAQAFVLPGGEAAADRNIPTYRGSGQETRTLELEGLWTRFQADPQDHELGLAVASAYLALGKTGPARNCLEMLRRIQPDDPRVRLASAIVAYQDGESSRARELLESGLALGPPDGLLEFNLGYLLVRLGDVDSGTRYLASVADGHPDSPLGRRAARELAASKAGDP
jgi:predicted Zn-dependent protease